MPLDVPRIKALCFDVDGTLSDTDDMFVIRLARWLAPFRFLLGNENHHRLARKIVMATETPGNLLFGLPDRLGIDEPLAAFGDWIYRLGLGRDSHSFIIIPGVEETLHLLRSHYRMAIVSARGERSTRAFLQQFQLEHFFDPIVTAQTCRRTKPSPDPVLWAANHMGLPAENCLMIGDTTVDIQAGKASGAQTVGVLCGFGENAELRQAGADLLLESTAQLPEHII